MAPTFNQLRVKEIANALFSSGLSDDVIPLLAGGSSTFMVECRTAAAQLRNPLDPRMFVGNSTPTNRSIIQAIRAASNNVFEVRDDVDNFISRAKEAGFLPPTNPLLEISRFNRTREVQRSGNVKKIVPELIDEVLADDIMFNLKIVLDLMQKERSGGLDLSGRVKGTSRSSAQISSYSMSLSGYDLALSDGTVDLMKFLPDIDLIKRKRIGDALGALNFKNRVPKVLFTMAYEPDGIFRGAIVCWKRMLEASSYTIRRHDVFENTDVEFEFTNENLVSQYDSVKEHIKDWALSFYSQHGEDTVWAILDKDVKVDRYYTYFVTAHQNVRTDKSFVFQVDSVSLIMSRLQLNDITNEIRAHAQNTVGKKITGVTEDDISPYPFLSKRFYGHDKYDWFLAAMNVRAAIDRGDDRATVRSFSYLGSRISFLDDQILAGKFFRPGDPNEIIKNVKESITTFGITQTLTEIIESTGLNFFFGAKESSSEDKFKRATGIVDETELGSLRQVLSAIDPETATIDVESLVANLLVATQGDNLDVDEASSPKEIDVPTQANDPSTSQFAEDPLQFVGAFDGASETFDLTTFEGISQFIRTIRLFFDMNPNRTVFGAGTTSVDIGGAGPSAGTTPPPVVVLPDGRRENLDQRTVDRLKVPPKKFPGGVGGFVVGKGFIGNIPRR